MWINLVLMGVIILCVITDLRSRRIYNKVIFPGLCIAFASHLFLGGWGRLQYSVMGFFVGLFILLLPYLFGGMGAGDVKLLALIGALKGTTFVLHTAIYMAIAGALLALLVLLVQGKLFSLLQSLSYAFLNWRHGIKASGFLKKGALSATYPYGLAIALGAVISLVLEGRGFLW